MFGRLRIVSNCLSLAFGILCAFSTFLSAQQVVDKTVATVSDGVRTELITYSDLKWQLALQPGVPINPPSSEDLNRALRLLIDQRLFALEAERLPREPATRAEINAKINEAEERIRAARSAAVKDIEQAAAELATEIARKVAGVEVNAADSARAVKEVLANA